MNRKIYGVTTGTPLSPKKIIEQVNIDTKANAIKNTAQGETILTTDSANEPKDSMVVYGKSWQNTVGGNQLFEKITSEGLGATVSADGLTATCKAKTASSYVDLFSLYHKVIPLTGGTTYYLSLKAKLVSGTMNNLNVAKLLDANGGGFGTVNNLTNPKINNSYQRYVYSFTPTSDGEAVRLYIQGLTATDAIVEITDIMVSTVNTEWEPYVGGIPSPNPNYPQEIRSNGESKNLFNHLDIDYMVVNANGDKRKGASFKEPNTYTISQNGTLGGTLYAKVLSADGTFGSTLYVNPKVTTTITHGQTLLVYTEDVSLSLLENAEVQVERGSVQTKYKPYGGSIEYGLYGGNLVDQTKAKVLNIPTSAWIDNAMVISYALSQYGRLIEIPFNAKKGETYHISFNVIKNTINKNVSFYFPETQHYTVIRSILGIASGTETMKGDVTKCILYVDNADWNENTEVLINDFIISRSDISYEPYTKQPFTLQTPNGLNGLKVTLESEANYKDADGNLRACDYIDLKRGKRVQRIVEAVLDGSTVKGYHYGGVWHLSDAQLFGQSVLHGNASKGYVMNKRFIMQSNDYACNGSNKTKMYFATFEGTSSLSASLFETPDNAGFLKFFAEHPTKIYAILQEPIETDLTEEEIAQYKSLMMNYPNTTILNDANAYTEVGYVADTKCYIDNKFKELEIALANTNAQLL